MGAPSVILNSELNAFARKYLVAGVSPAKEDILGFQRIHGEIFAAILEQLYLFDRISFKVYGENIPLVLLLDFFGVKGFEKLLEQNAIEFLLWTPMVAYNVQDLIGIHPIVSGIASTSVHKDPEESIRLGLKWLAKPVPNRVLKDLQKKITKAYSLPNSDVASNAARTTIDTYKSGKLTALGMSNDKDITTLALAERQKLARIAQSILETIVLSQFRYDSFDQQEPFALATATFEKIGKATKLKRDMGTLLHLEDFPDLKNLFLQNDFQIKQLIEARSGSNAVKFRQWLYSVSMSANAQDITKEYINSIANAEGFFETTGGKFVKTLSMYTLGAGVGAALSDIPGAVLGCTIAQIASPIADLGLDMLDAYFIEGLTKGWSPRLYIEQLKSTLPIKVE